MELDEKKLSTTATEVEKKNGTTSNVIRFLGDEVRYSSLFQSY